MIFHVPNLKLEKISLLMNGENHNFFVLPKVQSDEFNETQKNKIKPSGLQI